MYIVDAHLDLAWNALQWNRNIQQSAYTIRTQERHLGGADRELSPSQKYEKEISRFVLPLCWRVQRVMQNRTWIIHPLYRHMQQHKVNYLIIILDVSGYIRIITNVSELNDHISAGDYSGWNGCVKWLIKRIIFKELE